MEESKQEIRRAVFRTATVSAGTTALEPHLIQSSWKSYKVGTVIISILQVSNLLIQEPKLLFQGYTASQ